MQGGRQPAALRRLLRGPPVHPRARGRRRAVHRAGAHHRAGRGRALRRGRDLEPGGARPGRRGDLPLRVRQPLPAARVQRRPAPGQLPVPARRPGDVPRLRAGEALRARRGRRHRLDAQGDGRRQGHQGVPPAHREHRDAEGRHRVHRRGGDGLLRPLLRLRAARRGGHHHAGVRVGDGPAVLRLRRRPRRDPPGGQRPADVRDHPADQPRPLRDLRPAARHRELAAHLRGDLAVRRTRRRPPRWASGPPRGPPSGATLDRGHRARRRRHPLAQRAPLRRHAGPLPRPGAALRRPRRRRASTIASSRSSAATSRCSATG